MALPINWRFWERGNTGCAATEPLLSLYVDNMASPAEIRRVDAHLLTCEKCRQSLQWMQATHQVIAQRPVVAAPADLSARVAQAIAQAQAAKTPVRPVARRPLLVRPAFAYGLSVALFAAITGSIYLTSPRVNRPTGVTPPSRMSSLPPQPLALPGSRKGETAPPPVRRISPVVRPSTVAVKPPDKTLGLSKRHEPTIPAEEPAKLAVETPDRTPLPPLIPIHNALSLRTPSGSDAHRPSLRLATANTHADEAHVIPKKTLETTAPGGPGTQIASNPPVLPNAPAPVNPVVGPPLVTHDSERVQTASLSVNDQLHAFVGTLSHVALKADNFEASADLSSSGSGTVDIVHGPVK